MAVIKKRTRPKMGVRLSTVIRCPQHLAFIRSLECSVNNAECSGRMEAAHVRLLIGPVEHRGGTGMKPGDEWTAPLCSKHHYQAHSIGEASFDKKYKINMQKIAEECWAKSPAGRKFRLKALS